jgi:hypothetical protein
MECNGLPAYLDSNGHYNGFNGNKVRRGMGYLLTSAGGWMAMPLVVPSTPPLPIVGIITNRYSWTSYRVASPEHVNSEPSMSVHVLQAIVNHLTTSAVPPGLTTATSRPRLSKP